MIATLVEAGYSLEQAVASLNASNIGIGSTFSTSTLALHGAHSRPLSRRVAVGENTFWAAGDLGRDDHGSRDGSTRLAEFGVGHNFGPVQLNLSLGKTWANQNLVNNGDVDASGTYLMLEGIIPVSAAHGVYTTLGAYHLWGEADIRRGYLNADTQEYSDAAPDSTTWGVKVRVDWENAFTAGTTRFSPYADLSYTHSTLDAYTETGGGFPARFDERKDSITELRAGLNSATPIQGSRLDFVTNLEAVHRFDSTSTGASGEVIGQFAFDLAGEDYDQNWIKAGLGVEGQLGNGRLTAMLNGTTTGSAPSTWLAVSYSLPF